MSDFKQLHVLAEACVTLQQSGWSTKRIETQDCRQRQSLRIRAKQNIDGSRKYYGFHKQKRLKETSLVCELVLFKRILSVSFEAIRDEITQKPKISLSSVSQAVNANHMFNKYALGSKNLITTRRLFFLVEQKKWSEVCSRAKSYPQDARWRDSSGWTVLHRAVCDEAPYESVYEIWRAFPGALQCKSRDGKTPLHCAFRRGCETKTLKFLVDRCLCYSLMLLEDSIYLPLDILTKHVFPYLNSENPLLIQDLHGWTVLHWMVFHKAPLEQIAMIVTRARGSLSVVNCELKTPLHLACQQGGSPETIQLLSNEVPEALNFIDKNGRTPYSLLNENEGSTFSRY